jgi:hypothetical protein
LLRNILIQVYSSYNTLVNSLTGIYSFVPKMNLNLGSMFTPLKLSANITKSNVVILGLSNNENREETSNSFSKWLNITYSALINFYQTTLSFQLNQILIRFLGVGLFYIYYSTFIMYIDACLTDDEPIWEPIEWSLVQTWILFLFTFAWIAENLICSRYGSYTGRDKRVWFAW